MSAKLTVNLTNASLTAMEVEAARSEMRRTDVVNRALQLYAAVMQHAGGDQALLITDGAGNRLRITVELVVDGTGEAP